MTAILALIGGRKAILPLIVVAAIALALGGLWVMAKENERLRAENAAMKDYISTTKEVRDALENLPTDPDAIRERLRELSK